MVFYSEFAKYTLFFNCKDYVYYKSGQDKCRVMKKQNFCTERSVSKCPKPIKKKIGICSEICIPKSFLPFYFLYYVFIGKFNNSVF